MLTVSVAVTPDEPRTNVKIVLSRFSVINGYYWEIVSKKKKKK